MRERGAEHCILARLAGSVKESCLHSMPVGDQGVCLICAFNA